ncbi:hypothetical protein ROA7450_03366 [Roseovarius albus]|uniref:Uncharacterized protein n=1 Tax=Roseovarius albus TaxID=1247867 RepID=A0A1X6ZX29_9RHOB|nr:hypothetical protein ROA7450_03366 [Roseovarius albus]
MTNLFLKTALTISTVLALSSPSLAGTKSLNYTPSGDAISIPQPSASDLREKLSPGVKIWDAACCKVCRKGKACGNSCIKRTYTCHKGKGCACDG